MSSSDKGRDGVLLSIGQMAKLFDLNVRTLRYYDQIGLLEPEQVNHATGYRYYSPAQFERLNTILYLRALDVPIERIAGFFESRDVELMRAIFGDQLSRVREKQAQLSRIEQKIQNRVSQIDDALTGALDQPVIKDMPERRVVTLAENFSPNADLEPLIRDLTSKSRLHDAVFLGKVGVSVSRDDLLAHRFHRLSGVFIAIEEADAHEGKSSVVPSGPFACIRFRGTHADAAGPYRKLVDFIEHGNHAVSGNSLEITLIDAGMTADASQYVTELQIPISTRMSTAFD